MAITELALHRNQRKETKAFQPRGQQKGCSRRTPASPKPHPSGVQLQELKSALVRTYADVQSNHTLQMAAALSYYFVMSLFPAVTFLSAIVAFLPLPDIFNQALDLMGICSTGRHGDCAQSPFRRGDAQPGYFLVPGTPGNPVGRLWRIFGGNGSSQYCL